MTGDRIPRPKTITNPHNDDLSETLTSKTDILNTVDLPYKNMLRPADRILVLIGEWGITLAAPGALPLQGG